MQINHILTKLCQLKLGRPVIMPQYVGHKHLLVNYKRRYINKLQNDIILLIFKIWKFWNIWFVGHLIGDIHWNFHDDDIINVTLLVSQCSILPSSFLLQLASAEQHCELNEKSEQVQQVNVFKNQTLMFHFSTYRPNSCKHPITRRFDCMRESTAVIVASVVETTWRQVLPHQQYFLDHEQTFSTKHVLLVL